MKRCYRQFAYVFAISAMVAGLAGGCGGNKNVANSAQDGDQVQNLNFDFPVAVAGPLAQDMTQLVNQFNQSHPKIHVNAVFSGNYGTTMTKVETGFKSGNAPDVAVLLSTDMFTLLDNHLIIPMDDFAKSSTDKLWLTSFYPAFMANSTKDGKTYGIPFQRSTLVLYYNKDAFHQAGLNPDTPPKNWIELVSYGKKLTHGSQWGLEIPTSGLTYWEFQPFAIENGQNVVGDADNKVYFNQPKVADGLQFFHDLSFKHKIEPTGLIDWSTVPSDFSSGKAAMIYHSSGSLAQILKTAKFQVGTAMLPGNAQPGTPTGGGNFYLIDTKNPTREQAAYEFIKWMTSPDISAKWAIETGYIGNAPAVYQTPAMKQYIQQTPQADTAHQQLQYAKKELATHDGEEIQQILSTACQTVLTKNVSPTDALANAQSQADAILSKFPN